MNCVLHVYSLYYWGDYILKKVLSEAAIILKNNSGVLVIFQTLTAPHKHVPRQASAYGGEGFAEKVLLHLNLHDSPQVRIMVEKSSKFIYLYIYLHFSTIHKMTQLYKDLCGLF